ncbi:MAG TPA: hypothetical protein VLC94_11020 [Candidatus Acidoferrum sp.]|nr:hypothetical protein [Candidatus Acidoferrum sp.]
MQFGRFHGIALLTLGALLMCAQGLLVFWGHGSEPKAQPQPEQAQRPANRPENAFEYLPGVLGIVLLGLGGYTIARGPGGSSDSQTSQPFSGRPV